MQGWHIFNFMPLIQYIIMVYKLSRNIVTIWKHSRNSHHTVYLDEVQISSRRNLRKDVGFWILDFLLIEADCLNDHLSHLENQIKKIFPKFRSKQLSRLTL